MAYMKSPGQGVVVYLTAPEVACLLEMAGRLQKRSSHRNAHRMREAAMKRAIDRLEGAYRMTDEGKLAERNGLIKQAS